MSAYGIVMENGCYGVKKGSQFQPLSNCTFRLLTPVLAGRLTGYLARAVHKDGNAKEFFYPKGNMPRTKVEHFVSVLNCNLNNENDFFKRFTVQMTSTQLDALLTELENSVEIPETIPKAVSVIGKNISPENKEIWVLKHDLSIDAWGHLVAARDHGLCWIGHLVNDTGDNVAKEERVAAVHLPLTTYYFDLACHFLRGDMLSAVSKDENLKHCLDEVLRDCGIAEESLDDETEADGNFLPTFFTAAMSLIIAHYDKWQMLAGSCPLPAAFGQPDSGKSTACKLALAATGGWRNNFFASVSEKVVGKVASHTTMGFVVDDPSKPRDVGEAAKIFFNDGTNINCHGDWSPKYCPLFSVNNHVIDWLSKPDRERLLSRIIFVPFDNIQRSITQEQSALWQQIFDHLLSKVSSIVGQVIAMGQWLSSTEGRDAFNECLGIVVRGFGEEGKGTRFAKMWACGLMAGIKMQELTSAVSEDEVINFFMHVIAPHVQKHQKPALHVKFANLSSPTSQLTSKGKDDFVNRLKRKLEFVVKEAPKEQNLQFLRTDCTTSKLSGDGSQQGVLAIRAEPFQERCLENDITPIKPHDLRTSVQAYGLGLKTTEQRFLSPSSNRKRLKSCVMVKRSLFDTSTLDQLDRATGCKEDEKMEVTISQEVNLPAEDTDLEEMRRQKQELEKSLEGMKADYQAEMERLELENQQLKARALKEKEEREKYQELVKKRESEINELKEALKVTKEQSSTHAAAAASIKVTAIKFANDDKYLLACSSTDGTLSVCALVPAPPSVSCTLRGHTAAVMDFDWSITNDFILSASLDCTARVWDPSSGQCLRVVNDSHSCGVTACRFQPVNNNMLITGTQKGHLNVFNMSTGKGYKGGSAKVSAGVKSMEFDSSGVLVWVGDEKGSIYSFCFDVASGRLHKAKRMSIAEGSPVTSISYRSWMNREARDPVLLVNVAINLLCLYGVVDDMGGLKLKKSFTIAHKTRHVRSSFCPLMSFRQGACVVSASEDMTVYFFDVERAEKPCVNKLLGHSAPVLDVCWNYDESLLASCDTEGTVIVWKREQRSTHVT